MFLFLETDITEQNREENIEKRRKNTDICG